MPRHVVQRLILMVGTLIGVLTVTFVLTHILPGSPVEVMLGHRPTPDQIQAAKHQLGLDLPLWQQYLRFLGEITQGHFGTSFLTSQPVLQDIGERLMATVELTTLAMICIIVVGIPIGVLSAVKANSPIDHFVRSLSVAGVALPGFMLGMLLQMTFYGGLHWLPLQGRMTSAILLDHHFPHVTGLFLVDTLLAGDWVAFRDAAAHIVLPLATLSLANLPLVARTTRNLMVEALNEDHVRTAFAYGLPRRDVYFRYALKATLDTAADRHRPDLWLPAGWCCGGGIRLRLARHRQLCRSRHGPVRLPGRHRRHLVPGHGLSHDQPRSSTCCISRSTRGCATHDRRSPYPRCRLRTQNYLCHARGAFRPGQCAVRGRLLPVRADRAGRDLCAADRAL